MRPWQPRSTYRIRHKITVALILGISYNIIMIEKYVTSLIQRAVEPVIVRASDSVIQYFQQYYQEQLTMAIGIVSVLVGWAILNLLVE